MIYAKDSNPITASFTASSNIATPPTHVLVLIEDWYSNASFRNPLEISYSFVVPIIDAEESANGKLIRIDQV